MNRNQKKLKEGITAFDQCDYSKAFTILLPLAEEGIAEAQCVIASLYQIGRGVDEDWQQAVQWYSKAAEQGDALAYNNLGCIYEIGTPNIPMDKDKARECYQKAEELGFPRPVKRLEKA